MRCWYHAIFWLERHSLLPCLQHEFFQPSCVGLSHLAGGTLDVRTGIDIEIQPGTGGKRFLGVASLTWKLAILDRVSGCTNWRSIFKVCFIEIISTYLRSTVYNLQSEWLHFPSKRTQSSLATIKSFLLNHLPIIKLSCLDCLSLSPLNIKYNKAHAWRSSDIVQWLVQCAYCQKVLRFSLRKEVIDTDGIPTCL